MDSLHLCLLPFLLPTFWTSVQDGVHQAVQQLGRELLPRKSLPIFFTHFFFPFPCTSPLARPKPLLSFFFPAGFLLAGAPAIWGGTNGRNVAVEVSRALPRCWCPRAGLGLQPGLVGTAFAFPSQPRLRQGLVSVCPTSPPPDQALEQSRCCPHPCEQGRGECRGKEALPSGRTARTAHTNSAAGPGICSRLWSCKYLPLLPLKTCPRG